MTALIALLGGWRAATFAALALLALAFAGIQTIRLDRAQTRYSEHLAADASAALVSSEAARAQERGAALAIAAIADNYEKGKADAQVKHDRVVADLRAGHIRLQRRFQCPANLPGTDSGPGGGYGFPQGGLSDADAEFLVHFAGEADQVALQLGACQSVIVADRVP